MATKEASDPNDSQSARKTYETPRLVSYGSISKLTQGRRAARRWAVTGAPE